MCTRAATPRWCGRSPYGWAVLAIMVTLGLGGSLAGSALAQPAEPPQAPNASEKLPAIDLDMLGGIEDGAPVRNADQNFYEARAYTYLLVQAHKTAPSALAQAARRDLNFAHLFEEATKYRGEIIHVEGQLRRLRRFDAPKLAAQEGVPVHYEGWVFSETSFGNPYCVITSEIPESVSVGERLDRQVSFDGYFFKRYRYKAGDGWRDAPLLIGRRLTLLSPSGTPEASTSALSDLPVLPALIGLLAITGVLVIGLAIWFRRGDRQVRAVLERNRHRTAEDAALLNIPTAESWEQNGQP